MSRREAWTAKSPEILILRGHRASVVDVVFDPDGDRLASASADGTIRVYVLPLDELITFAESRLTRTWTPDECQQYLRDRCPAV